MQEPEDWERPLNDQELAAEIYSAADDLNDLLLEAANRRLYVPVTVTRRNGDRGQYDFISSPVYQKITPSGG